MNKLVRLFNNPTVRRIVVWAAPLVVGWIMKKIEDSSTKKPSSSTPSTKKKK